MGVSRTLALGNHVQSWPKRRVNELVGLGLLCVAAFIAISLLTFHESDPSFNMAADHHALNWAGRPGAYIANPLLQTLGLTSFLLVAMVAAWGWRLFAAKRAPSFFALRVAVFCLSAVLLCVVFASIETPVSWPVEDGLGGAIGLLVARAARHHIPGYAMVLGSLVLLAGAIPAALGLTWGEWKALKRGVVGTAAAITRTLLLLRTPQGAEDEADEKEDDEEGGPQPWFRRIMDRFRGHGEGGGEEEGGEEEEDPAPVKKPKRVVKKDLVVQQKVTARLKAAQASLELRPRKGQFALPPISLLSEPNKKGKKQAVNEASLSQNARLLETVLGDFGVNGEIVKVRPGPVVTLYELEPSPGTKSSRVIGLADDIARSMSAVSARIATVTGRNVIGIELPNQTRETVYLRELLEDEDFANTQVNLPLAMGKDIGGTPIIVDLARMPHLLVAGTTGSGKSVAINTMITSLLYKLTPEQCKFIMIDPKMLELSVYDNIPHLLSPVVTEPGKAVVALKWTVKEMENRYRMMSSLGVRNIEGYNKRIHEAKAKGDKLTRTVQTGFNPDTGSPIIEEVPLDMTPLPFIVVVVDEMADLMLVAGKEIESSIQRLAQMARAAGIHIIMATQRPSVDVITGVIKANFPTRVSFQVTSRIDSRTILGEQGAEQLLGQGDMLYMAGGGRITRIHGPFVSDKEVEDIVAHLREQGAPNYVEDVTRDPEEMLDLEGEAEEDGDDGNIYRQAVAIVLRDKKASTSYLQRTLKLGYNRAARLIDRMENEGIVGPANHVGKREVLG